MDLTHDLQELSGYDAQWVRIGDAIPEMTSQHPVRMPEAFHHLEVFSNPMLPKVFMNLVDNSVRHGVCATDLWIECAEDPAGLIIAFNDNGVGIPSADKERIFNRGYGKNTGLGLFLVREVLKFTNISIIENGSEGQGARFELKVPPGSYRFTDLQ
jgi:signal transduction histidine kinase